MDTTPHAQDRSGETCGHYKLNSLRGTGTFAQVYSAEDIRDSERIVAIKILLPNLEEDVLEEYQARFEEEQKVATGKTINKYSDHHAPLSSISWSSDSKALVTVSDDGTMFIWDAITKQKLPICLNYPYQKQVTYAIWSPHAEHLAIAVGNQVFIYDDPRQSGYAQRDTTFNKHTAPVRTIAWSSDGKALISGADDGTVIVWLAEENKELHRWLHTDSVTAVAYSSDGTLVASGSQDHSVLIFYAQKVKDIEQWSQFGSYHHDDQVTSLAWVHSTLLASSSDDNTVQGWDFGAQEPHQLTLPHPDVVNAITCSPDGQHLISACDDKLARVWKIQQG
jgi:WD40 repeat protein